MSLLFQLWIPYAYAMRPGGRGDRDVPLLLGEAREGGEARDLRSPRRVSPLSGLIADVGDSRGLPVGEGGFASVPVEGGGTAASGWGASDHGDTGVMRTLLSPLTSRGHLGSRSGPGSFHDVERQGGSLRESDRDVSTSGAGDSEEEHVGDGDHELRSMAGSRMGLGDMREPSRVPSGTLSGEEDTTGTCGVAGAHHPSQPEGEGYQPVSDGYAIDSVEEQPLERTIRELERHYGSLLLTDGRTTDRDALEKLIAIEKSWSSTLRWKRISHLPQLIPNAVGILDKKGTLTNRTGCMPGIYLRGGFLPIRSTVTRRKVLMNRSFWRGLEDAVFSMVNNTIKGVVAYQLYEYAFYEERGGCGYKPPRRDIWGIWTEVKHAKDAHNVLQGIFHDTLGSSDVVKYMVFGAPVLYALLKTVWDQGTYRPLDDAGMKKLIGKLKDQGIDTGWYMYPKRKFQKWKQGRYTEALKQQYLMNQGLSPETLREVIDVLEELSPTSRDAIHGLSQIVYGLHHKDLLREDIKRGYTGTRRTQEEIKERFIQKGRAYRILERVGRYDDVRAAQGKYRKLWALVTGMNREYARYMLWQLGRREGIRDDVIYGGYKALKLYVQGKFLYVVVNALMEALYCPAQPGVSIGGIMPWARDLTQACFMAAVDAFNIIPGQPVETLVGNLDRYHFPTCEIELDLSNKGLDGFTIANITHALTDYGLIITSLNGSHNTIESVSTADTVALGHALRRLSQLEVLDISHNQHEIGFSLGGIGSKGVEGTAEIGASFFNMTRLLHIDLSHNSIGLKKSGGINSIGQGLTKLSRLAILNLSNNHIGSDEFQYKNGELKALARGIGSLSSLLYLDLSMNQLGYWDDGEYSPIGNSLKSLFNLKWLNLSYTGLGYRGPNSTISVGKGLRNLTMLTALDLSYNLIGKHEEGFLEIAAGLKKLEKLNFLSLSSNFIQCLKMYIQGRLTGDAIRKMKELQSLDLSRNCFSSNGTFGIKVITDSFAQLRELKHFDISFQHPLLTSAMQGLINMGLNHTLVPQGIFISSPEKMMEYCAKLDKESFHLDLSARFSGIDEKIANAILNCSLQFANLRTFNLSRNYIEYFGYDGFIYIIRGMGQLVNLTSVDLSHNAIGHHTSFGKIELRQTLTRLKKLQHLDLSYNSLAGRWGVELGKAFQNMSSLTHLDLSHNEIGMVGSYGVISLAQGMINLDKLKYLDLSANARLGIVGLAGAIEIGSSLRALKKLLYLDLSNLGLGWRGANGTIDIGRSLTLLSELRYLNLSGNYFGQHNENGVVQIGKGLTGLRSLMVLDLSNNFVGKRSTRGVEVFGQGLSDLKRLEQLYLQRNYIGSMGNRGVLSLGFGLSRLDNIQTLDISVNSVKDYGMKVLLDSLKKQAFLVNVLIEQRSGILHQYPDSTKIFILEFYLANSLTKSMVIRRDFSLQFMSPLPWGDLQGSLYSLQSDAMSAACDANRCYAAGISSSTITPSSSATDTSAMVVYDRASVLRRVGAEVAGFRESMRPSPQRKLLQTTTSFPAPEDHGLHGLPEEEGMTFESPLFTFKHAPRGAGRAISAEKALAQRPAVLSQSRPTPVHSMLLDAPRDGGVLITKQDWPAASKGPLESPEPPAHREVAELPWMAPVQASAAVRAEPWGGWLVRAAADWGTWALDKAGEGLESLMDSATDGISDVVASSPSYFPNASNPHVHDWKHAIPPTPAPERTASITPNVTSFIGRA